METSRTEQVKNIFDRIGESRAEAEERNKELISRAMSAGLITDFRICTARELDYQLAPSVKPTDLMLRFEWTDPTSGPASMTATLRSGLISQFLEGLLLGARVQAESRGL